MFCLYLLKGYKEIPLVLYKDKKNEEQIAKQIESRIPGAMLLSRELFFDEVDNLVFLLDPKDLEKF